MSIRHSSGAREPERSVPIGTLILVKEAADELGFDTETLFRSIAVEPGALRYPMTPIPLSVVGKAFIGAKAGSGCAHFAALAGARARLDNAGIIPQLVMRAKYVRHAVADLTRFLRIWYHGVHFTLRVNHGWAFFTITIEGLGEGQTEMCTSYTSSMNRHLQTIIGGGWRASRVFLARPKPQDVQPYCEIFNALVIFDAAENAIEFPADVLDRKRDINDEHLNAMLREQLVGLETLRRPSLNDEVRRLIEVLLVRGDCSVARVAEILRVHRQTLYRHLRNSRTTFKDELKRSRRQNAERMLAESDLPIAEISRALGYKESVNFIRAFKRWTGVPPHTWRSERKAERKLD
ncbi:MAG: AraC family transcriptional regulator ligand-binding domain-containing protein [Burkholderiaceae bacterium]